MPTMLADGPSAGAPTWFVAFFIICAVAALIGAGFRLLAAARRYKVYRRAGLSPLTHNAQIEAKIAQARFKTESKSVEQRLTELDDLCQRGVISDSERAQARARILADG
jgi:cytochrome c-type biogenesis protein CcmH/NrfG